MKLLTESNPKTLKGEAKGFWTFILHLAPSKLSGYNVCAKATPGCEAACLNIAGHGGLFAGVKTGVMTGAEVLAQIKAGAITNVVQSARIRRTHFMFRDKLNFFKSLEKEITAGLRKADKAGLVAVFRLNGTSDLPWERMIVRDGKNIFELFPNVRFYDYTKIPNRDNLPANYSLTFSLAENNDANADEALTNGTNVAVVFRKEIPATWNGRPVVNGDETDLRFLDVKGVYVGLKAKGKAKKDTTGFVRDV